MNETRKQEVSSEAAKINTTFTSLSLQRQFICSPTGLAGSWMPVPGFQPNPQATSTNSEFPRFAVTLAVTVTGIQGCGKDSDAFKVC